MPDRTAPAGAHSCSWSLGLTPAMPPCPVPAPSDHGPELHKWPERWPKPTRPPPRSTRRTKALDDWIAQER
jgi:hypothetical protein